MGEAVEVQMARLEERLRVIVDDLALARDSRKQQYEIQEKLGRSLVSIENRLENVETSLARATPTIDEFLIIKHKVVGAGLLGKWLWAAGGSLIGLVFASREAILGWLSK